MIERQSAGGDEAMEVEVIFEGLIPVCNTAMIPTVPPKRLWPNASNVSLTALNRRANTIFLWARIKPLRPCGKVKTRWK